MSNNNNPWLGLKTYVEGQVLYGRSEEINALSQDILFNRQTIVYGKSGIGKSSILNAGIFPILRRSKLFPVNVRLIHEDDNNPINYNDQIIKGIEESLNHLRRETVGSDGKKQTVENLRGRKVDLCPSINRDEESLWEYFHRHMFYDDQGNEIYPVIVFDQFEEIFTLCKDEGARINFFDQLADLINDVPPSYLYSFNEITTQIDIDAYDVIDGSEDIVLEEDDDDQQTYDYNQDSRIHIVITLREEFLSYLERYTTNIPLMKHNRYCLRPLSVEQAGTIISDPVPGLISEDVAYEIICKVTDSISHEIPHRDGIAQLEVDPTVLSLFLSELYKKKKPEDNIISIDLVRAYSGNIISSFYERTIKGISEKSAEYLENKLVTPDKRRDSVFTSIAAKEGGVTNEELTYLKKERLIHEFPWNGAARIEFMHDILCPVVLNRKRDREQKAREDELRKNEEVLRKKNSRRIRMLSVFSLLTTIVIVVLFIIMKKYKDERGLGIDQQFFISLSEDSLVVADNDYWKASLRVIAISDSSETCILDTLINKSTVNNSYSFSSSSAKKFKIDIDYGDNSRYEKVSQSYTIGQLTENPSIPLIIKFAERHFNTYESNVVMNFEGINMNIQDAVVIIKDKVQRTDGNGHFCFKMEDPIQEDAVFYIVKDGFDVGRFDIATNELDNQYVLTPSDSLSWFFESVIKWVAVDSFYYRFPGIVVYNDGRRDSIYFSGNRIKSQSLKDKFEIEGYYFFRSEYDKYVKNHKDYLSCHFFKGKIDKSTDGDGFRCFEVSSTDVANNRQVLYGKMKERDKKDPKSSRDYKGEIKSSTGIIGAFETDRKLDFPKIQYNR